MKEESKLIFACRWDRVMEKSWSGSAYAVYQELGKRFTVERFDIKDTPVVLAFKLLRKLHLVSGEPSLLSVIKASNRKFQKRYSDDNQVIFQFSETPWTQATYNYIYQDLAIAYIAFMKDNDPRAYAYCGFANISGRELEKRKEIQREFYEHCSGIFTMGHWLADFLHEDCGIPVEKIHAVGAGINVPIGKADYSEKKGNKILFVGKDFERKGGKLVVEAFRLLKEKYRADAELFIVGPIENPLNEQMDGIKFIGNLDKNEVAEYFKMCDIFCMPSYFEAFGIAFCEALANGLPCIARNKYAMSEIIKDGEDGYLITDDDAEELALKMYQLLSNHEITQKVRSKREEYIEKYSWKRVVDKMETVINISKPDITNEPDL